MVFNKFIERVEELGFEVKRVGGNGCLLLLLKKEGKAILVGVYKGEYGGFYSKLSPLERVPVAYWSCDSLVYVPHGLYVFADDEKGLADRTATKISRLLR